MEPTVGPFMYYLDAFRLLDTCRNNGMSLGPIPFTAIVEYTRIYEVEDVDGFITVIRMIDNAYLEIEAKNGRAKNS